MQQGSALPLPSYQDQDLLALVRAHKPAKPLYVMYPEKITQSAQRFVKAFPGKALFAVKTNPDPIALQAVARGGVKAFDVASLAEIKAVHALFPKAELHFMHTIKAPEDISAAYHDYGVRHFVLDHEDELFKIMRETDLAQDLNLTVRVALPKSGSSLIDFSSKFGASLHEAADLLQKCRPVSRQLSLSFHVGTQTTDPQRYSVGIDYCAAVMQAAGVGIDAINIGGGFPVAYADQPEVCTVESCIAAVQEGLARQNLQHVALMAEPGRVLVANGAKLVTRVELRKGNLLYINDGVYGGLFDAARWVGTHYPVAAVSCDRPFDGAKQAYRLAGPTCDSLDMMEGPFELPADIGMGDWIIFDQVGAYSQCIRSDFNGFGEAHTLVI
jgi:ornithine decarboxylase